MDSWYFSLVLCFERFFWKNQQIFPLLLVKYLSFREGRDGKRCECVSVAEPIGRVVAIVLERGPVNSRRNCVIVTRCTPTISSVRYFFPHTGSEKSVEKSAKIGKILPNH